jgi:hypothetical protein
MRSQPSAKLVLDEGCVTRMLANDDVTKLTGEKLVKVITPIVLSYLFLLRNGFSPVLSLQGQPIAYFV